jgi:nucleotide-binding universal stress UspA family protein
MAGIVVAIDGSPNSERALDWALRHAAALSAPLTVLTVHEVPKSYWGHIPVEGPADKVAVEEERKAAEEMTQRIASQLGDAAPADVRVVAVIGFVVEELVNASRDADMLVVGARGVGGFARLLLGSVSSQIASHSVCPVVLVPHQR